RQTQDGSSTRGGDPTSSSPPPLGPLDPASCVLELAPLGVHAFTRAALLTKEFRSPNTGLVDRIGPRGTTRLSRCAGLQGTQAQGAIVHVKDCGPRTRANADGPADMEHRPNQGTFGRRQNALALAWASSNQDPVSCWNRNGADHTGVGA